MWPYLICFAFSSSVFFIISDWSRRGVGFWFWSVVALLVPCLLAGFRAETIGTDVLVYAKPLFDLAANSSSFANFLGSQWWQGWKYQGSADYELGYVALVWISGHVFHSLPMLLFLTQALTALPIFAALLKLNNKHAIPFGMMTYYFLYFNVSLNVMRQWVAMAIVIYSVVVLYRRGEPLFRQLPCLAGIVGASLFHASAFFGFIPFLLLFFLERRNCKETVFILCAAAICLPFLMQVFSVALQMVGLGRYVHYIDGALSFMPNQILLRLPLILISFWAANGNRFTSPFANFLFVAMLFGTATSQFVSVGPFSGRIALYFDSFGVFVLSTYLVRFGERKAAVKVFTAMMLVFYLLFYWWFEFCLCGVNETIPYLSILD